MLPLAHIVYPRQTPPRKPMTKKTVFLICIGIFAGILGFDGYLYTDGVPGNSISQTIIYFSHKCLLIPWFIGGLMGFLSAHLFDNYTEPK